MLMLLAEFKLNELKKYRSRLSENSEFVRKRTTDAKAIADLPVLRLKWEEKWNRRNKLFKKTRESDNNIFNYEELAEYYGWQGEGSYWDYLDEM